jgi:hypothetical protein
MEKPENMQQNMLKDEELDQISAGDRFSNNAVNIKTSYTSNINRTMNILQKVLDENAGIKKQMVRLLSKQKDITLKEE